MRNTTRSTPLRSESTEMELRPIQTEREYEAALAEIERLFDAKPGTPEGDHLQVWTPLVEAHESVHHPVQLPDPIDMILYYLESRGLSQSDSEPFVGTRATVMEVLSRKRALTIDMIRRLHDRLGISAEILIQPYPLEESVA